MSLTHNAATKVRNVANYSLKRLAGFAVDRQGAYDLHEAMTRLLERGWTHIYVEVDYDDTETVQVYGVNPTRKLRGGRSKVNGGQVEIGHSEPPAPGMVLQDASEKPADASQEETSPPDAKGKGGKGKKAPKPKAPKVTKAAKGDKGDTEAEAGGQGITVPGVRRVEVV